MILFDNKYPYTDFHEMNLDWLLAQTSKNAHDIKYLKPYPDVYKNRYAFYVETPADINGKFYYVSATGDDARDGLTEDTSVQTIRRAIELASMVTDDIRIRIVTSGVYDVDYLLFCGQAMHIVGMADNIVLNYTKRGIHYMSHVNIAGKSDTERITVRCSDAANLWYCDGGSIIFDSVDFECTVRINDGALTSYRTGFRSLLLFCSKWISGYRTGFNNSTDSRGAIYMQNSDWFNTTKIDINLDEDDPNGFIYARGSRITNTQQYNFNTAHIWAKNDVGQTVYCSSNTSHTETKSLATTNSWVSGNINFRESKN